MANTTELTFEMARRLILLKPTTTLSDEVSLLGYDGDPNSATGNTTGEFVLSVMPAGAMYMESNGTLWVKKSENPDLWVISGEGDGKYLTLNGGIVSGNTSIVGELVVTGGTITGDGSGLTNLSINNLASYASQTINLSLYNWSNNRQTVTVTGVTATNDVTVSAHPDSYIDCANSQIRAVSQELNTLTFHCTYTPVTHIKLNIKTQ